MAKFRDHGGVMWEGQIQQVTIPASVTINLDQDYDLIADKLTLNGQIITNGHKLNLFVREMIWGENGKILAFAKTQSKSHSNLNEAIELDPFSIASPPAPPKITALPPQIQERTCSALPGGQGYPGTPGLPGYSGMGAECRPGQICLFKGNQKVKPSAIQVFAIHQGPDESNKVDTGTNNNKQNHEDQTSQFLGPMIDGTGQKGGKGGSGGQGGDGAAGQNGFHAAAKCSGFGSWAPIFIFKENYLILDKLAGGLNIGSDRVTCPNGKAGNAGPGGIGGLGGPGGIPGAGGAPVPIAYQLGYAQLNDLQVGADNQRHLKGQFTSIEGPDGELGDIGPVGDPGPPGEPGRGASDKKQIQVKLGFVKITKTLCEVSVDGGAPANPGNNAIANAENLSVNKNKYNCALNDCNQKFNANLYYANGNSQTKPYKTLKPQLDWFNSLSLEKDRLELQFLQLHWARMSAYLYYSSLLFLQGQHQVTIDQIYQLRNNFIKNRVHQQIINDDAQEIILKKWQHAYIEPIQKSLGRSDIGRVQKNHLRSALMVGLEIVDGLTSLQNQNSWNEALYLHRFLNDRIEKKIDQATNSCKKYDEFLKQNSFSFPRILAFYQIPACKNLADFQSAPFDPIRLKTPIVGKSFDHFKSQYPGIDIQVVPYSQDELNSSNYPNTWQNYLKSFLHQISPLPQAEANEEVTVIYNKEPLNESTIFKIQTNSSKPLTAKGAVVSYAAPRILPFGKLAYELKALSLLPLLVKGESK